jgi:ribosome modulation factor
MNKFDEGYQSAVDYLRDSNKPGAESCPYDDCTTERRQWMAGWDKALCDFMKG